MTAARRDMYQGVFFVQHARAAGRAFEGIILYSPVFR